MRIAVSGSHATGKSTLIDELARRLPGYAAIEEPYYTLTDEGHVFAARPGIDDFAMLLERSLASLDDVAGEHVLFDRCAVDYLAYASAIERRGSEIVGEWAPRVSEAITRLDLIVLVAIERPDRIRVPADERPALRRRVDAKLREMLVDGTWGFRVPVLQVSGTIDERVRQVLTALYRGPGSAA